MSTKICGKCKEEKNLSEYYAGKSYSKLKGGVDHYCKDCRNGSTLKIQRRPGKVSCTVEGCSRRHYAKGYCRMHYDRVRDYGRVNVLREMIPLDVQKQMYRTVGGKQIKHYVYSFENRLKTFYNITPEQWNEYAIDGCNICGAETGEETDRNLHVDHDHKCCPGKRSCGKCVRGVVCNRCNTAMGLYENNKLRNDYPNRDKIIEYLVNYDMRHKQEESN